MKKKSFIFITIFFICFTQIVSATNYDATPLKPGPTEKNRLIGGFIGLGQNIQNGTAFVNCDSCQFNDGIGFGYNIGILYDEQMTTENILRFFSYGAMLQIANRSINSSFKERKPATFPEYDITFPINYRHTLATSINSFAITPFIGYNQIKYIFFRLGLDISYVFSNNEQHTIELLDKRKTLPNGEIVNIYMPTGKNYNIKSYSNIVQNSNISAINQMQFAITPMFGGNIFLTKRLILAPSFQYYIPLNKLSDYVNKSVNNHIPNYKIAAYRFAIELKYNLTDNRKNYYK